jgi:hypothetical protein
MIPVLDFADAIGACRAYADLKSPGVIPIRVNPNVKSNCTPTGNMERFIWALDGLKLNIQSRPLQAQRTFAYHLVNDNDVSPHASPRYVE